MERGTLVRARLGGVMLGRARGLSGRLIKFNINPSLPRVVVILSGYTYVVQLMLVITYPGHLG